MFDNKSFVVEREMENGVMEKIESDDFSQLTWITDFPVSGEAPAVDGITESRNAMIVKTTAYDDGELEIEYEGYWLQEDVENPALGKILYIVEADTLVGAQRMLELVIANPTLAEYIDTEKYVLSTKLLDSRIKYK